LSRVFVQNCQAIPTKVSLLFTLCLALAQSIQETWQLREDWGETSVTSTPRNFGITLPFLNLSKEKNKKQ